MLLDPSSFEVYRTLLEAVPTSVEGLVCATGLQPRVVDDALADLSRRGLLRPTAGSLGSLVSPALALASRLDDEEDRLRRGEQHLALARRELDRLSREHEAHLDRETFRLLRGADAVRTRVGELVREAHVEVFLAGDQGPNGPLMPCEDDLKAVAAGVCLRAVWPFRARSTAEGVDEPTGTVSARGQVRTRAVVPVRMLLVDQTTLLLPHDPHGADPGILEIRTPGIVATLGAVARRLWASSDPVVRTHPDGGMGLLQVEREVLWLLAEGHTDESVARRLGLSARTVGRIVAGLLERLEARSRFEGGVKAARAGWFDVGDLDDATAGRVDADG